MSEDILILANNLSFLDEVYARFVQDPESVEPSWRVLFTNGHGIHAAPADSAVPQRADDDLGVSSRRAARRREARETAQRTAEVAGPGSTWPLVNAYRVRGHLEAELDPLGLLERPPHPELEPAKYGFSDADLDKVMASGGLHGPRELPLREIVERCRSTYCGSIGLEFMHISTPAKKQWLARMMETRHERPVTAHVRRAMLEKLIRSEVFESFIHRKYPGTKRFSLEGGESLIPLLEQVLDHAGRLGTVETVLGMAHRGRLAVLHEVLQKPASDLFSEFDDVEPEATLGGGDVKYHLGFSSDRVDAAGNKLHLSLAFNPSHLEAVDPVVVGRVRAKQRRHRDWDRRRVLGILLHGDAAFAGQGLVPETLNLSNLHGYRSGGTVHIIVNNQIGFTASPTEARSTPYSTDVAKMIQCPIWHVNAEDLDAIAQVVHMAMEYRAQFQSDVVIDMYCYRKYGHNEMDEPSFTQPLMYKVIKKKKAIDEVYGKRLLDDGVLDKAQIDTMHTVARESLDQELEKSRATGKRPRIEALGGVWAGYYGGPDPIPEADTAISDAVLEAVRQGITRVPEDFTIHSKIQKLFEQRDAMAAGQEPLDWAMGEAFALGSLLLEGRNIRLTGQDSARGTFSHRHAIVTDIETGEEYMPLAHLRDDQAQCRIYDSPLSEAGVLGFEFGYSLDMPEALVMWEAQFGDFINGAQVILDQFICASEDKWKRLSGLVLLLPHGYEGQGPEHSSARIERFLQSCAEDNWQIAQPTTPAQYFHLLRRQVYRRWRKPLVVMTPKSLLRLPAAVSDRSELSSSRFYRVLLDPGVEDPSKVSRVMLCSGKVYYDLVEERSKRGDTSTAIVRIELLYPWRDQLIIEAVKAYGRANEVIWVQEEPENMGAWSFAQPRLQLAFRDYQLRHCARDASASPATGSSKAHGIEQRRLLDSAFGE